MWQVCYVKCGWIFTHKVCSESFTMIVVGDFLPTMYTMKVVFKSWVNFYPQCTPWKCCVQVMGEFLPTMYTMKVLCSSHGWIFTHCMHGVSEWWIFAHNIREESLIARVIVPYILGKKITHIFKEHKAVGSGWTCVRIVCENIFTTGGGPWGESNSGVLVSIPHRYWPSWSFKLSTAAGCYSHR